MGVDIWAFIQYTISRKKNLPLPVDVIKVCLRSVYTERDRGLAAFAKERSK